MNTKAKGMRLGIHQKLFLAVLAMLAGNLLLLLLLGSTTFERLYVHSKLQDLQEGAAQIRAAFSSGPDSEEYSSALSTVESGNVVVQVFHRTPEDGIVLDYYTRRGFSPSGEDSRKHDHFLKDFLQEFYEKGYDERLARERYVIPEEPQKIGKPQWNITLYARLGETPGGETVYLSLDTPRQFIAESAQLAIQSCATISLFTLIFASVILYLVCRRITEPVREIQRTAEHIAAMDFSARCAVRTRDELGLLAEAVNEMSDSLQENIHSLENANQMLRDDLHRQEQQDMMRKRFIANVSHDFKTPLTLITSYADSVKALDDSQRDLREEYCDIISSEGYKMTHMVQMLLNLSRLESGMVTLSRMVFPLSDILTDAIHRYKLPAEQKRLQVELRLEEDFIVDADYQRIEQVVVNLYENAVKYTGEGGAIRVSAERTPDGHCLIRMFNSSAPIPPEHLEKLFISFYRTDEARGALGQSYGLGLAIVRSILELHRQEYGVRNAPGGVEFWFQLPIAEMAGDDGPDSEDEP